MAPNDPFHRSEAPGSRIRERCSCTEPNPGLPRRLRRPSRAGRAEPTRRAQLQPGLRSHSVTRGAPELRPAHEPPPTRSEAPQGHHRGTTALPQAPQAPPRPPQPRQRPQAPGRAPPLTSGRMAGSGAGRTRRTQPMGAPPNKAACHWCRPAQPRQGGAVPGGGGRGRRGLGGSRVAEGI